VDYYGHCWYEPSGLKKYTSGVNAQKFKINFDTPNLLKKQYPKIDLTFEEPRTSVELIELINLDETSIEKIILENPILPVFISQFYSIDQALRHFDHNSRDKEYDFVVLSRYDNFIALLPNYKRIQNDKLTVKQNPGTNGFPDLVFIGTRQLLEGINVYPKLNDYLKPGKKITPELLKEEHFFSNSNEANLSFQDFELLVVRDSKLIKYLSYFVRVRLRLVRNKLLRREFS
jgi:hypothetical protein